MLWDLISSLPFPTWISSVQEHFFSAPAQWSPNQTLVYYLTLWISLSLSVKRALIIHTSPDCESPSSSSTNIHFPSLLCCCSHCLTSALLILCFPVLSPSKPSAWNLPLEFCLESTPVTEKGFRGDSEVQVLVLSCTCCESFGKIAYSLGSLVSSSVICK